MELIKITLIIVVLIILIRLKFHLSLAIFISSILLIFLYKINFSVVIKSIKNIFVESKNYNIIIAVILITYFGTLLSKKGNFKRIFNGISLIIKDLRFAIAFIPAFIGMIPMPGGALFSAPMVNDGGDLLKLSPEEKHLINFIFRHVWEFFLPLYPAILLLSNFFNIPIDVIIKKQFIYTVIYFVIGVILILIPINKNLHEYKKRNLENKNRSENINKKQVIYQILVDILPVIAIIFFIVVFKLNINIAGILVIIGFSIFHKIGIKELFKSFKESFSISIVLIILSIIFFKSLLETSNALKNLPVYMQTLGIPPVLIISFIPFIVGFLTGITVASIGVTYPILKLFYYTNGILSYNMVVLSLAIGFMGVMVSPMHLCLSLTKQYFKADFTKIYKKLIPIILLNIIAALILYFLNYPTLP